MKATAPAQVEGQIDMKMTRSSEGKRMGVLYSMFVKGDLLAAKTNGGGMGLKTGKFIFRGDKKTLWVIDDEKKSCLEIPLTGDEKSPKGRTKKDIERAARVKIEKTGKTDNLLGYPCSEWITEDEGKVTHIWGTSRLGNIYDGLMKSFEKMNPGLEENRMEGWEGELAKMKIFPVKIVSIKEGDTLETQEVTNIDSRSVPASMFEIPSGYKKEALDANVGKLMQQMQEQMKKGRGGKGDSMMNTRDMKKLMKEMEEKFKKLDGDSSSAPKDSD
jgi:hypothetical protein